MLITIKHRECTLCKCRPPSVCRCMWRISSAFVAQILSMIVASYSYSSTVIEEHQKCYEEGGEGFYRSHFIINTIFVNKKFADSLIEMIVQIFSNNNFLHYIIITLAKLSGSPLDAFSICLVSIKLSYVMVSVSLLQNCCT